MKPISKQETCAAAPFQGPPFSLLSADGSGIFLFYGDAALFRLSTLLTAWPLAQGASVLFLDGGNCFDPYPLIDLAKKIGRNPQDFLAHLYVSRAFTCHQMGSLIFNQLRSGLTKYQPRLVVLASPLTTFYDENVPFIEAKHLLIHWITALQQFSADATFIVLSPYPKPSAGRRVFFFSHLSACAKRIFRVTQSKNLSQTLSIFEEKPQSREWEIDLGRTMQGRAQS